ncbi:sodium:solute symporter family transporter [Flavobacterium cellulosilyticum]|uniref:Sodium transporter n=1 Tax=Flavobacterium cellulosilyticum TaxID=2541731 RepID=A0A4R5C7J4_9FLAO|nr:sodium/solute symporter [Flavobacterium cellulosilyticum]TDD94699.1 sodium transporter [Flavobacterium cellulosilyticum]
MNTLQLTDYLVFLVYFCIVSGYGLWIYKRKQTASHSASHDYFLAEGSLTWWAIGTSLIASNISSEQFIAMSGNGFKMGLAIATYEWMAAITLIVVAVFFIPVYLKNKIFTMPQFLSQRYNGDVAMIMAVFWLLLYIVVNLTSILYLGALAVNGISGINLDLCMYGLAFFAIIIALGGMKVIGYTDVIQVVFLIFGGLVTTYLALDKVAELNGQHGMIQGFNYMIDQSGDHFHMILKKDNANFPSLPGLTVLFGGMWIVNLNYWGCNQYITQRALGADLKTARSGILFAAFLKLLMPVIVVLPGIAAYVIYTKGGLQTELLGPDGIINPDRSYPVLLNLLPVGLKGLSFAALTAAVVASLAGKVNSIATIFTLDIFKKKIDVNASENKMVTVGKITVVAAMLIAVFIAPHLGIDKKGGFDFIQEYSGFVSPGIFAMFIMGFFWKKTSSNAAMFATIGGFVFSVILKFLPQFMNLEFLSGTGFSTLVEQEDGISLYEIPFLDRMGFVFAASVIIMIFISLYDQKRGLKTKGLEIDSTMFKVNNAFLAGSLIIVGILVALYSVFW